MAVGARSRVDLFCRIGLVWRLWRQLFWRHRRHVLLLHEHANVPFCGVCHHFSQPPLRHCICFGSSATRCAEALALAAPLPTVEWCLLARLSPLLRDRLNEKYTFVHPEDPRICELTHLEWTGQAKQPGSDARNAVFYGDQAIDRSPCGTGTSARMAQLVAQGKLGVGDSFVHESYIGSQFTGRVEALTRVGDYDAIIPSIEGWARIYGENVITVDPDDDPYWQGFLVF